MSIRVTVLGSSAMFATRERSCSGYLLEYSDSRVWMDAGGGTWRELLEHIDYEEIDAILLSHKHPDHTIDVFQAFHARMYGQAERLPPIPLWAPEETIERVLGFYPEVKESFDLVALSDGDVKELFGARWTFTRMAHPPQTMGMRVEFEDTVVAYSADTGPSADFAPLAGDADLFICEATFQDDDEPWEGHMSATDAGTVASGCGVQKLLLTHLPPGRDLGISLAEAHRTCGSAEVQLAADGLRLDL